MPILPKNEFIINSLNPQKSVSSETSNFTPEQAARHEVDKMQHLNSIGAATKKPNPLMQRRAPAANRASEGQGR